MSLVNNERTKLTATFISGLALATFAVGSLGPIVGSLVAGVGLTLYAAATSAGCFVTAVALHLAARRILGRLLP